MGTDTTISGLMFFTIGATLLIVLVALFSVLRKRRNRHPMEHQRERNADEMERGVAPENER